MTCFDGGTFWTALSAISTFLLVVVVLFMPLRQGGALWQRKKLKIRFSQSIGAVDFIRTFKCWSLEMSNVGNRKIVVEQIYIPLLGKEKYLFIPGTSRFKSLQLPCKIDVKNQESFLIEDKQFSESFKELLEQNKVKRRTKIIIVIEDTAGKRYSYKTKYRVEDLMA